MVNQAPQTTSCAFCVNSKNLDRRRPNYLLANYIFTNNSIFNTRKIKRNEYVTNKYIEKKVKKGKES